MTLAFYNDPAYEPYKNLRQWQKPRLLSFRLTRDSSE